MRNNFICILCESRETTLFHEDSRRSYLRCLHCRLVFVPPPQRLSPEEEKQRYDLHENDPDDEGYREFLGRLFHPLNEMLPPGSFGLDFGSGPGPTLHLMFKEEGHRMNIYDPFYTDDSSVFDHTYDFITATEVIEHLYSPLQELDKVWHCIKPGGFLGIMTKMVRNREAFENWHYIRDDTHVAFYSKDTFQWLAGRWDTTADFVGDDVILFQKG